MSGLLDHIMWGCDDLERASQHFEALTGVTPRYGGVHASGVTHNALVSIGPRSYLEILAPTGPAAGPEDTWCRLARAAREPKILTYCLRSGRPLPELAKIAQEMGAPEVEVLSNGRVTPEGVRLNWQWLAPTFGHFGLAFPFFIDWLDSPHPATTAQNPAQVQLQEFSIGHPRADELRRSLAKLGAPMNIYPAREAEFRLQLDTPRGIVCL